ncbi:MAG: type II secretion system F family protein [Idiomarina sp.]|nr:type II secretion system F family protein [Idiomarina sp.]
MANFNYQGRDRQGRKVNGAIMAVSESVVAEQLLRRGIVPLSIVAGKPQQDFRSKFLKFFERAVPLPDLVMFIRQMYSLTKAGIPMLRAVSGLAENASHKKLGLALKDIAEQLERGRSLSAAMMDHPKVFPRLVVAVVHVGENTGKLEESFSQLAFYLETEQETRKRLTSAMRYPSIVMSILIIAIVVLNIFVIPNFSALYASMNVDLPAITLALLASSAFFTSYWYLMLIGVLVGIVGVRLRMQKPEARRRWDRMKLKIPAVGSIIERSLLARFCRSFSVMLNAGVPLTQGLNLVSDALDNAYMGHRIIDMRKGIERGESLLKVSRQSELFSDLVLQMVAVGEETGSLDELLMEAAEYYEREVDYDLKNIMDRIGPIMTLIVAVMVGVVALATFLPMWDMLQSTGRF